MRFSELPKIRILTSVLTRLWSGFEMTVLFEPKLQFVDRVEARNPTIESRLTSRCS